MRRSSWCRLALAFALAALTAPGGAVAAQKTIAVDPETGEITAVSHAWEPDAPTDAAVVARYDSAGTLVPDFGREGYTRTVGRLMLRHPDGRVTTMGERRDPWRQPETPGLERRLRDGSLDPTFGDGGRLPLEITWTYHAAAALEPDGSVLLADVTPENVVRLRRIDPSGATVSLFAQATAPGPDPPGTGPDFRLGDLHATADGVIVSGSSYDTDVPGFLIRLKPDGRLDPDYGDAGVVETAPSQRSLARGTHVYVLEAGRLGSSEVVVSRYGSDGSLDTAWAQDGRATVAVAGTLAGVGGAFDVAPGGAILLGTTVFLSGRKAIAIARLTPDGGLDAGYGSGGQAVVEFGLAAELIDLLRLPSGGALISAMTFAEDDSQTPGLARLTAAGDPDTTFSGDGQLVPHFDVLGPEAAITAGPSQVVDPPAGTSAGFSFTSSQPGGPFDPVSFRCRLDTGPITACEPGAAYHGLPEGDRVFEVQALDARGNPGWSRADWRWVANARAPDTGFTAAPSSLGGSPEARFEITGDEPLGAVRCRLDGVALECGQSVTVRVGDGEHVFEATGVDSFGAADPTPVVHRWTVDLTGPEIRIDSGPPPVTRDTSAQLTFSSSDPAATFECRLGDGPWTPCTSPYPLSGLASGIHIFGVRAIDPAGNISSAERIWGVGPPDAAPPASPPGTTRLGVRTSRIAEHRIDGRRRVLDRIRVTNPLDRSGTARLCATYPKGWRPGYAKRPAGVTVSGRRVCLLRALAAGQTRTFALAGRAPKRERLGALRYTLSFPGLPTQEAAKEWLAWRSTRTSGGTVGEGGTS